jgi:secondary thiamine-phosphate synthase enzyme
MTFQALIEISTRGRGLREITTQIERVVRSAPVASGIVHVFARHTSCSLLITENADPAVLRDFETLARRWAPDGDPEYEHDAEGADDMAAHARSVLAGGAAVTIPLADGKLLLGTWQGVFLWEHRTRPQTRQVAVTVLG